MKITKPIIIIMLLFFSNIVLTNGRTFVESTEGTFDYTTRTLRQVFYAEGYHFIFYLDSEDFLVYRSSSDGNSFSDKIIIAENLWSLTDFSLKLDENKHVHLVYSTIQGDTKPDYVMFYHNGVINEKGEIDWLNKVKISSHPSDTPFLSLNSLGHPVIVYRSLYADNFQFIVSEDPLGENWSDPLTIHSWESSQPDYYPSVYGLDNEELMFIYWDGKTDRVYSVYWNGTELSEPEMLYNCFDFYMTKTYFYYCWSGIVDANYSLYFTNPVGEILTWVKSSKGWRLDKPMRDKRSEVIGGLSYDPTNDKLYLIILNLPSKEVQIYHKEGDDWTGNATTILEFSKPIKKSSLVCSEKVDDGILSLRWFEGEGESSELLDLFFAGIDLDNLTFLKTKIRVQEISTVPHTVTSGETVNVTISIVNDGNSKTKDTLQVLVNGLLEHSLEVILDTKEEKTVRIDLKQDTPGTYNVTVNEKQTFFTVTSEIQENGAEDEKVRNDVNFLYPLLLVAIVISVLIYFYYNRSENRQKSGTS
jgi:hypothetical protein